MTSEHLKTYPHILVVGPAWVGDMVMAQSLFKTLKRHRTDCIIDVLAPDWTAPLATRMPEVRDAVPLAVGHGELKLGARYRLGRKLRANHYAQAIVLPNSFKSALVPYWADIPRRTGFVGEFRYPLLNDWRVLDKTLVRRTVDRFVSLGLEAGEKLPTYVPIPQLIADTHHQAQVLERLHLDKSDAPILALCPGAEYGPAKRWPAAHFAEVAKHFYAQGWQVWIFGSENDMAVAAALQADSGEICVNLSGRTNLVEAVDLLALATASVSNDSGLMHVAAALEMPLVAVYGSSDPGFTPPLGKHARVLSLELECSPCFKRECPLQHLHCLRDLTPRQVIAGLEERIQAG